MHTYLAPIVDRKIRFALVGCGRIARHHFAALQAHADHAELVGICDISPTALEQALHEVQASAYHDLQTLLQQSNADVIVLTTPSGLHASQAIEAARTGHHVISEKPMATTLQEGRQMIRICDAHQVRLFVVKQNRFNPTLQQVKQAISAGRFGKIYMVNANVFWTRPQSYYDSADWRGTWAYDGGALMNQASHYFDLLHWLIGPLESVQAYTATLDREIEVEDSGVIHFKWRAGTLGAMNVTMLTYPKNLEGSLTIIGEKGTVRLGGIAVNEIQHWEFAQPLPEDEHILKNNYPTDSVYGHGHWLYYQHVIDVLRGKKIQAIDGHQGLHALEAIIASYRSAQQGQSISLPLDLFS